MKRLQRSFGFAWEGIHTCFKQEANFKIHTICSVLVIAAGFYFGISHTEWLIIIICIGLVFSAELLNTAIEGLCNLVTKETHPLIKIIKDISAAGVLVLSIAAFVCALLIFIPKILQHFNF
ncbi:MAG: diacylglycerol kinase family protein [Bacteroidetes bacterium]|jgi:diacylglycerol kinase (ATP)|nr:diacylglycerol kinase family protein [Bacteroidota bacterium]